jgi:nitroimidazol reductase NimA-like FMN-containing flavoprotein (pyridoxamine 5'-phosphate oxidase superfamily)
MYLFIDTSLYAFVANKTEKIKLNSKHLNISINAFPNNQLVMF